MPFGQFVIGPPGSGKTTYCHGMSQFMRATKRKVGGAALEPPKASRCELPWSRALQPLNKAAFRKCGGSTGTGAAALAGGAATYHQAAAELPRATRLGQPCISSPPQVVIVNLDPANDVPPYTPDVDVSDLVDLQNVMEVGHTIFQPQLFCRAL